MRKTNPMHVSFVLLTAFMTAILMAPAAFAAESGRFGGESLYASFKSTDPSGCIKTQVYIEAANVFGPTPPAEWFLSTSRINDCGGYRVLFSGGGRGPLEAGLLNVSPPLSKGALQGVFRIHDRVSNSDLDVSIDLVWIGGEEISRGHYHSTYHGLGERRVTSHRGITRWGVVSGTVSFGTENLTPNEGDGYVVSWMQFDTTH